MTQPILLPLRSVHLLDGVWSMAFLGDVDPATVTLWITYDQHMAVPVSGILNLIWLARRFGCHHDRRSSDTWRQRLPPLWQLEPVGSTLGRWQLPRHPPVRTLERHDSSK